MPLLKVTVDIHYKMTTARVGVKTNCDATELKILVETKFPNYTVLDITNSLSPTSYRTYIRNIADKPNVILIAKKTPKSEIIFAIMGEPEHEFMLLNRDNFLTIGSTKCKLDNMLTRMLNNERYCCICSEEASLDATSCEQCGVVSCHACIIKWYNKHGCYNCPICRKLMPMVPIVMN